MRTRWTAALRGAVLIAGAVLVAGCAAVPAGPTPTPGATTAPEAPTAEARQNVAPVPTPRATHTPPALPRGGRLSIASLRADQSGASEACATWIGEPVEVVRLITGAQPGIAPWDGKAYVRDASVQLFCSLAAADGTNPPITVSLNSERQGGAEVVGASGYAVGVHVLPSYPVHSTPIKTWLTELESRVEADTTPSPTPTWTPSTEGALTLAELATGRVAGAQACGAWLGDPEAVGAELFGKAEALTWQGDSRSGGDLRLTCELVGYGNGARIFTTQVLGRQIDGVLAAPDGLGYAYATSEKTPDDEQVHAWIRDKAQELRR